MKVYVLEVIGAYNDPCYLVGVYTTLDKAKERGQDLSDNLRQSKKTTLEWSDRNGVYFARTDGHEHNDCVITEMELDGD